MKLEKIRLHFGLDLLKFSRSALVAVGLNAETIEFLSTVGLPRKITDGTELKIETFISYEARTYPEGSLTGVVIGKSEFGDFVIENSTGFIFLITLDMEKFFINSNIQNLLLFCMNFLELHVKKSEVRYDLNVDEHEEIALRQANHLREIFKEIDPVAMQLSDVWITKLEEVENGII